MAIKIVTPGGKPSGWLSKEQQFMADRTEVIDKDGVYSDGDSFFQYRKGHILPPGRKARLKRVGDFEVQRGPGVTELEATKGVPADERLLASAKAKADEEAAAKAAAEEEERALAEAREQEAKAAEAAEAAAKAAEKPDDKAAPKPENKKD